jgi:hypothetical protein
MGCVLPVTSATKSVIYRLCFVERLQISNEQLNGWLDIDPKDIASLGV